MFSRFPEVYPVRDLGVPTLINAFRDFFARYGFPDALITDRGTQFQSKEFQDYLSRFQIKKLSTTSYRPSSNGICERLNGTLQMKLKAILQESGKDKSKWTEVVPVALMAKRNDPHSTTGFTPSELMFTFRVKDLSLSPIMHRYIPLDRIPIPTAATNIAVRRNAAAQRHRFEDRVFEEGTTVLVRDPSHGKLELTGHEAKVVRQIDPHVVKVEDGRRSTLVSSARLSPIPPQPLQTEAESRVPGQMKTDEGPEVMNRTVINRTVAPNSHNSNPSPIRLRRQPNYLSDYDVS